MERDPGRVKPMPKLLVLIRHAATVKHSGREPEHERDLDNDIGYRQAMETGRAVAKKHGKPDAFFHSGFLCAELTMRFVLKAYPGKMVERIRDILIREREPGLMIPEREMTATEKSAWFRQRDRDRGRFFVRNDGGESLAQATDRVRYFLDRVAEEWNGRNVFVCTHAGTILCFRFLLENWGFGRVEAPALEDYPPNCSVTAYRADRGTGRLRLEEANAVYWGDGGGGS